MKLIKLLLLFPFRLIKWLFTVEEGCQDARGYHRLVDNHTHEACCYAEEHMQEVHEKIRRFYHGDAAEEQNIEQKAETYSHTYCN